MLILNSTNMILDCGGKMVPPSAGYDWNRHISDELEITSGKGEVIVTMKYNDSYVQSTGDLLGTFKYVDDTEAIVIRTIDD